ncbi:MAG: MCE family protein [Phycisphaerales bacterium]|nr:MCE family protein [Phycisphaerales bacterium]
MHDTTEPTPPEARIAPARRWSWAWLVPLGVLAVLGVLGVQASRDRPLAISIRFTEGSGLREGDPVSCKGVHVGEVRGVRLASDAQSVIVEVSLARSAANIAVEGSRFWVVRPEVSLRGVSGLEAILGPRTIAVEPGAHTAARVAAFTGLDDAPPLPDPTDGSLLLTLRAARRGSLDPGSPVTYRDIQIGRVLQSQLADDATAVEIAIAVDPPYAQLVRENTCFFNTSGITADWRWFGGLDVRTDSLESVITGGIGLATPTKPGARVGNGHVFDLADKPESDWLEWEPTVPLREPFSGG